MSPQYLYAWQAAYLAAARHLRLGEGCTPEGLACIEDALCAFDRRFAEWGSKPGTNQEFREIRKAISDLRERLENPRGKKASA